MKKSILYIGSLNPQSNSYRRFQTLGLMGYETIGIDVDPFIYKGNFARFHHHFNWGPGINALNKKVVAATKENAPGIIWVDNKSYLKSATLKKIKALNNQIKIINLVTDDITGKLKYQWRIALKNATRFDCFFVQRRVNVAELKSYGAKRVELCYRSYDPGFHRPVSLVDGDELRYKSIVGFVGTYESDREQYVAYLIQNNIPVVVTGDGWPKGKYWKIIEPFYRESSVYGESYIKTLNGMDIALHFLRHGNRDEQDSRTFEIPACGVFMLAEKSAVHLSLFDSEKEAVFFTAKEELLEKVKYYLEHEEERKAIAEAGLRRCRQSGYSHEGRLSGVVNTIATL